MGLPPSLQHTSERLPPKLRLNRVIMTSGRQGPGKKVEIGVHSHAASFSLLRTPACTPKTTYYLASGHGLLGTPLPVARRIYVRVDTLYDAVRLRVVLGVLELPLGILGRREGPLGPWGTRSENCDPLAGKAGWRRALLAMGEWEKQLGTLESLFLVGGDARLTC